MCQGILLLLDTNGEPVAAMNLYSYMASIHNRDYGQSMPLEKV